MLRAVVDASESLTWSIHQGSVKRSWLEGTQEGCGRENERRHRRACVSSHALNKSACRIRARGVQAQLNVKCAHAPAERVPEGRCHSGPRRNRTPWLGAAALSSLGVCGQPPRR